MYYLLAHMIGEMPVGAEAQVLPLHMTLVHWFSYDGSALDIEQNIKVVLAGQKPLELTVGEEAMFVGLEHPVAVNKVARDAELLDLHKRLVITLDALGVVHTNNQWTGDDWNPHVTHQKSRRLHKGDRFKCDSVNLISSDDYARGRRLIVSEIPFG